MDVLKQIVPLCDDWVVILLIVSFVIFSLTIGSDMPQVRKSLRSMFNFKKSDGQLVYVPLSLFGLFLASIHTAISIAVLAYLCRGEGLPDYSATPFQSVFSLSVVVLLFLLVKIIAYTIVNGLICRKYYISPQHFRWISFYIMVNAIKGALALLLSVSIIYLHLPVMIALFAYLLIAILLEIGILFKLFSVFFKKKCSVLIFFVYLCALEIAPCFLVWFSVK